MSHTITTEFINDIAISVGFTEDELFNDPRIILYGQSLISVDNQYKIRNFTNDGLSLDDYYTFISNVKNDIIESMDHVQDYDIIKCEGKNNMTIMYTDYFNSITINWGEQSGMSLQFSDDKLIELRDKLIAKFPL